MIYQTDNIPKSIAQNGKLWRFCGSRKSPDYRACSHVQGILQAFADESDINSVYRNCAIKMPDGIHGHSNTKRGYIEF